jgi:hypothetical protein
MRMTLDVAITRPTGAVGELEWPLFLRDDVTKGFPDGLTVWGAEGQRCSLNQESELWETARVCVVS